MKIFRHLYSELEFCSHPNKHVFVIVLPEMRSDRELDLNDCNNGITAQVIQGSTGLNFESI